MNRINFRSLFLGGFAVVATLTACNDKEQKQVETQQEVISDENLSKSDTIKIIVNSNDEMKFDKNEIKVWDGQTVVLTLNHTGTMPKTAMGHNLVLLDNTISIGDFSTLALDAKDTDYIPADKKSIIAHTDLIGGGESTTITFKAPKVGSYDYLCSFPGHYAIMKGKFIVQ